MGFATWANSRVKKFNWVDIALIKVGVAGFVLMIGKLWEPLLGLDWYWYAVISIPAAIRPVYKALRK